MLRNELAQEKVSHSLAMSDLQSKLYKQLNEKESEISKLKTINEDQTKEKSKHTGFGDKPNSEYEILLNEKNATIAEYLSGSDFSHDM